MPCLQSAQIWPDCNKGITQFYLPPYLLPLLPSHNASPTFGWYSLRLPTKGWPPLHHWLRLSAGNWGNCPGQVSGLQFSRGMFGEIFRGWFSRENCPEMKSPWKMSVGDKLSGDNFREMSVGIVREECPWWRPERMAGENCLGVISGYKREASGRIVRGKWPDPHSGLLIIYV